jgi:hypothetical protein
VVHYSRPIFTGTPPAVPPTGWEAASNNRSGINDTLTVYVVCAEVAS